MIDFPCIKDITRSTPSRIVMLVVDGLGGLADPATGRSELETARLPNLDEVARRSAAGLTTPVAHGITPGSGPGHLALFGYDPVKHLTGRGVLEALGAGVELQDGDVAVRGNLCTVDGDGLLVDRRAGRIASEDAAPLVEKLSKITLDDVAVSVHPVKDYRFVVILRGNDLGPDVTETDPQTEWTPALEAKATSAGSLKTATAANAFVEAAREALESRDTANMVLLRGFSQRPHLPQMGDRYRLNPAAIAAYPMYRGLAHLVGMKVLQTGETFDEELATLESHSSEHDFFFLHYKPADAAGEDGDFPAKVEALEELDSKVPRLLELDPDVLVVAGDHSTPAVIGGHSWHPVPLLVSSRLTGAGLRRPGAQRACLRHRQHRTCFCNQRNDACDGPCRQAAAVRAVDSKLTAGQPRTSSSRP